MFSLDSNCKSAHRKKESNTVVAVKIANNFQHYQFNVKIQLIKFILGPSYNQSKFMSKKFNYKIINKTY